MNTIAIIQGEGVAVIKWFKTQQEADDFIAQWLRDNPQRPYVRCTIATSVFVIEG